MKFKKEYLILSALIIALSAYILTKNTDRTHYTLPVMDALEESTITGIQIEMDGKSLELKRTYDNWFIEPDNFPASSTKVNAMLSTIEGLKLTALVSESKNYGRYDLDDKKKISVSALAAGKVMRKFDIGKTASSYQHTFVKLDGNNGVYHAQENFRNRFPVDVTDLTDKKVLEFSPESITEIAVKNGDTALTIKKEAPAAENTETKPDTPAEVWKTDTDKVETSSDIKEFLGTFASLTCENYVSGLKKEDLTNPLHTFTVKGDKEYDLSIYLAKEGAENFTATSSKRDVPFVLTADTVDKIVTKLANLQ